MVAFPHSWLFVTPHRFLRIVVAGGCAMCCVEEIVCDKSVSACGAVQTSGHTSLVGLGTSAFAGGRHLQWWQGSRESWHGPSSCVCCIRKRRRPCHTPTVGGSPSGGGVAIGYLAHQYVSPTSGACCNLEHCTCCTTVAYLCRRCRHRVKETVYLWSAFPVTECVHCMWRKAQLGQPICSMRVTSPCLRRAIAGGILCNAAACVPCNGQPRSTVESLRLMWKWQATVHMCEAA